MNEAVAANPTAFYVVIGLAIVALAVVGVVALFFGRHVHLKREKDSIDLRFGQESSPPPGPALASGIPQQPTPQVQGSPARKGGKKRRQRGR